MPLRSVAPIRSTDSDTVYVARRMLGTAGVRFTTPKLRSGRPILHGYTPAQAAKLLATMRLLEARAQDAAEAALLPKSRRERSRVRSLARAAAPAGVQISAPVVSKGDNSASVSISASVDNGAGDRTTVKATIEARVEADGRAVGDVEVGLTRQDQSGITKGDTIRATILGGDADYCPSGTGEIRYAKPYSLSQTGTFSQQFGPINSGTVTTVRSASGNSTGLGRLSTQATLEPIPFKVTVNSSLSLRGSGLAGVLAGVLGAQFSMKATAVASGTINPATGAISRSARFDVRTSGTGDAAKRATAAKLALDEARSIIGTQYAHFKAVEKRARDGECTRLDFSPAAGAAVGPGATIPVKASLDLKSSGQNVPAPVSWTMTPVVGGVSPTSGTANGMDTTVTGAAPVSGTTARIMYRAVSRAGISTGEWTGVDSPFPATYTGTLEYQHMIPSPQTTFTGAATVTYRLGTVNTLPDGMKIAIYSVEASNVTSIGQTSTVPSVPTDCTFTYGPLAPGAPQTLETSDVEIQVTPPGVWSAAVKLGVDLGDRVGTAVCPGFPTAWDVNPKFLLNTRTPTGALRAMDPKGEIVGVGVPDTLGNVGTGSASWNLQPGG